MNFAGIGYPLTGNLTRYTKNGGFARLSAPQGQHGNENLKKSEERRLSENEREKRSGIAGVY